MKSNSLRVLIVDDEKSIRRFLKAALSSHGYQTFECENGSEAVEALAAFHPDMIILDLGLPDKDGLEVMKEIRKRTQTPIIILSVREQEQDKVAALNEGADDYLTKPFSPGELIARMRVVMRRLTSQDKEPVFKTGQLCVDLSKRVIQIKNQVIHLTPTEYEILKIMVLSAGKVVTHQQLLSEVWNKSEDLEGVGHLLRVTISNLRGKIEPNPNRPSYLLTETGVGYRLRETA